MTDHSGNLRGDVDTPRPIRARRGQLLIEGWCLRSGVSDAPDVRLSTGAAVLPMTGRIARPDLAQLMPDEPAAAGSGFEITGPLPAGIHLARLEARMPDGAWCSFKTVSLAVESIPFSAGLDSPPEGKTITRRIHLEGWALHPQSRVKTLTLRYGHQEIPCILGLARSDLPTLHPDAPHASVAGFKSTTILAAGHGPLRLRAKLANGSPAIARTAFEIAIPTDENIGSEINLASERIGLPHSVRASTSTAKPTVADQPLNLLFVLHGSFASNSALHVTALADELAAMGHCCSVAVTHDLDTLHQHREPRFQGILHVEAEKQLSYPNAKGPDIMHAWTTRENVRVLTEKLRHQHPQAKVIVHLEDNERLLLAMQLGLTQSQLDAASPSALDALIPPSLSHPRRSREFLDSADGITLITERLREFAPDARPCHLLRPAADARYFYPRPFPRDFRRILDRTPGETVLFYHGNAHAANAVEMRELYAAVLLLNREGTPATLIRTGLDTVDFLGDLAAPIAPHVLSLGQILHHEHLPNLMALADFFVQPGAPDDFNNYRFPSKLPEFFSMGRPVILPRANLGEIVQHGRDAYVLDRADARGIARAVRELRADPAACERLSRGAVAFAETNFSWRHSAAELAKFYSGLTA